MAAVLEAVACSGGTGGVVAAGVAVAACKARVVSMLHW